MPAYPTFSGGIVTQRPYTTVHKFRTQVSDLDHGPRYSRFQQSSPSRVFECTYQAITDAELTTLVNFFTARHGQVEEFEFTDPNTTTLHAHCRFESDELQITDVGKNQHAATVRIIDFTA